MNLQMFAAEMNYKPQVEVSKESRLACEAHFKNMSLIVF